MASMAEVGLPQSVLLIVRPQMVTAPSELRTVCVMFVVTPFSVPP